MAQINFNDKDSNNNILTTGDINAIKSTVNENEGIIANTNVSGYFDSNDNLRYNMHLIPESNADYDLGNAEYKVRHLFLSDNSLWIGDTHKVDASGGEVKTKKRDRSVIPAKISQLGGSEIGAQTHAGVPNTRDLTLSDIELYAQSLDPNVTLGDIFPPETNGNYSSNDYEAIFEQSDPVLWTEDKLQGASLLNDGMITLQPNQLAGKRIVIDNADSSALMFKVSGIPQVENYTLEFSLYVHNIKTYLQTDAWQLEINVLDAGNNEIQPQKANYDIADLRDSVNIIDVRLMYFKNNWISFISNNLHRKDTNSLILGS